MSTKPGKLFRCAIYTRKSTEHGLELEFNSLDAQREACEAYIRSQASEGWRILPKRYDDAAYSGGNLERPALQRLLKDMADGQVDVVVVYKIDRLTRSLMDFAKLVEVFDAKKVSFVAITQQFNTTTSMGRLTLNVLLSFAQFERELASERVRDKLAASRKKGKWTGGSVPLGYDCKDKRLVINPVEAKTVRMIFDRYLALRSFQKLITELDAKGIVSKKRPTAGRIVGGIRFTYGPLAYLLKNRVYLGETGHSGRWYPGEHAPIIDRDTFERVQQLLKSNTHDRTVRRHASGALLSGLLFDDRGNRMSPSFAQKEGVRYRFYVSSALLKGRKAEAGSAPRVSASEIEAALLKALRARSDCNGLAPAQCVEKYVGRVVVHTKHVAIALKGDGDIDASTVEVPFINRPSDNRAEIDESGASHSQRIANPLLAQAIVRAHNWLKSLSDGTCSSVEDLAHQLDLHPKVIRKGLKLTFLSPAITKDLLIGEQRTARLLSDLEQVALSWDEQSNTPSFRLAR
ncbi:MAG: recombinase family protein [Xanthobacteraceae bacterium]